MATYIALVDFTEQGVRTIAESPARAEAFASHAKAKGVTIVGQYWTSGDHDGVVIVEAPDEESVSAVFLDLAREGNVRTRTLRAFDAAEMKGIVAKLG